MLAGIGAELGAIQCRLLQAQQPCRLAEPQHRYEKASQRLRVLRAEVADPAVVGLLVAREHPEGGVFQAGFLKPAVAGPPDAMILQEQQHHHSLLIMPFRPSEHSEGRRPESPLDPAQFPDRAGRTPGGSPAANPPVSEGTAASAPGSRDGRTWA